LLTPPLWHSHQILSPVFVIIGKVCWCLTLISHMGAVLQVMCCVAVTEGDSQSFCIMCLMTLNDVFHLYTLNVWILLLT
jgi:hypothetical protein